MNASAESSTATRTTSCSRWTTWRIGARKFWAGSRAVSEAAPRVGALEIFTLSFGTVVGIAWIFLLPAWLTAAGPIGTALAIVTGVVAVLPIALCYSRTVRRFPGSGGEIRYVLESFGGP